MTRKENKKRVRWSLSLKMMVSLFVSAFLTLVTGLAILYSSATKAAVEMNDTINRQNMEVTRNNIRALLNSTEVAGTSVFYDNTAKTSLLAENGTLNDPTVYNTMRTNLNRAVLTAPDIGFIALLKDDGSMVSSPHLVQAPFYDYASCLAYLEAVGYDADKVGATSVWMAPERLPSTYSIQYGFMNVRLLRTLHSGEETAVMLTYMKEESVWELYSAFGEDSFIVDSWGMVVSAGNKARVGSYLEADERFGDILRMVREKPEKGQVYTSGNLSSRYIPELDAYLVAVADYTVLDALQGSILVTVILLVAMGLIASYVEAIIISNRLTRSTRQLTATMDQVRGGDLTPRFAGTGSDEIAYLGTMFNTLMDDLEQHIAQVKFTERQKKDSELRLLQSQINPHLLYNTLDSVLYYLENNDAEHARKLIEILSDFFKLSLSKGKPYETVARELEHVRQYADLQRTCRGKAIDLVVRCAPGLEETELPQNTLQPIIENAFLHAYEGPVNDGTIQIDIAHGEGETVVITVCDDGMGMDEQELQKQRDDLLDDRPASGGFGLWNVNQRIRHRHGQVYGITIDSEFGVGTRVAVTVPAPPGPPAKEGGTADV